MSWLEWSALAAIALGIGGAFYWQRANEARIVDAAAARRWAERALAGFVGGPALVAPAGNAALVAGGGTVALVLRRGTRVIVRRLIPPLAVAETAEGSRIATGDPGIGVVELHGITVDEIAGLTATTAPAWRTLH